jgi:VIT1/CCC1 family predicted Fe2+/Mn2+ transporter
MAEKAARRRYEDNLQGEIDSAALYRTLSKAEKNPDLAQVYSRLASVEEAHAEFWGKRLQAMGQRIPKLRPNFRARALGWLARRLGPSFVLPTINTLEHIDSARYDAQPEAVAGGLPGVERSHARILEAAAGLTPQALSGGAIARLEGRHRAAGGNALRAAVLGANDGLVSNLSLIMGVAGASLDPRAILITGLAGLLAGACSMALGEWLSVNSSRESYQRQIATEAEELEQLPDEEREELALIYQAKGLPAGQAEALAERLTANKETALDTLAREELGINPEDLGGSAWVAAASSFALFAVGALFAVAPFFILSGTPGVIGSLASSGLALFLIGAGTTFFTGRSVLYSGARQLLVGLAAAAITYGIGRLIGVALS